MKTAKKNTEIYDEVRSKFDPTSRCPGDHGFECLHFLPHASDAIKMHLPQFITTLKHSSWDPYLTPCTCC